MIEALASRVFATRNLAHIMHWKTQSFAEHSALGDFYSALPGAIDEIVEAYQGAFGLIGQLTVVAPLSKNFDILTYLVAEAAWIEEYRPTCSKGNTGIENLIDSLLGHYYSVIYKLRNLH